MHSKVTPDGTRIALTLAEGVTPRFYAESGRSFMFDIDLTPQEIDANRKTAEAAAKQAEVEAWRRRPRRRSGLTRPPRRPASSTPAS